MRKLVFLTILMLGAFVALAQNKPSSQPSSAPPSAQAGSQNPTGRAPGEQTIEGCIVKQSTTYYIQPTSGGSPTKLSASSDVASHEGHDVVVHGSKQSSAASGAGNTSPSSAAGGQSSSSSADQTFNVTRVDMIATNCPASKGKDTSNPK